MKLRAVILSALAAIAVQPLLFGVLNVLPGFLFHPQLSPWRVMLLVSICVVVVAGAFVILLGVPVFLLLYRRGWVGAIPLGLSGFLLAVLPVGILNWPIRKDGGGYSGDWYGHYVVFIIDGVPTFYGWLSYAATVLEYGLHGLAGALVFLVIWRRQSDVSEKAKLQ